MDASELTWHLMQDPDVIEAVSAELQAGNYSYKARLHARWTLYEAIGCSPDEIIRDAAFTAAARDLDRAGDPDAAQVVRELENTGAELTKASREWSSRYTGRPQTAREQTDAQILAAGQVIRRTPGQAEMGADGARYEAATMRPGPGRTPGEIALVTTSAGTVEIVAPFAGAALRDAWIKDRLRDANGPLSSWDIGPGSRTTREEQMLAWAMRHGDGTTAAQGGWRASSFLSHLRSELFLAWVTASEKAGGRAKLAEVEDELEWRMLRSPWWGSLEAGGRRGDAAISYLHRLAQSEVSTPQAMRSAQWLIQQDRQAARAPRGSASQRGPQRTGRPAVAAQRPRPEILQQQTWTSAGHQPAPVRQQGI